MPRAGSWRVCAKSSPVVMVAGTRAKVTWPAIGTVPAASGRTMLMATHDIPLVRDISDYIIFMVDGRIVEQGPAQKLLHDPDNERTKSFLNKMGE